MRPTEAFADLPATYRWFAGEAEPTSPIWAELCRWIAESPEFTERLSTLAGEQRRPNLFLAAIRFLGGPTTGGPAFLSWLEEHWPTVATIVRTRSTQTNEVGRCAVVAPVLASVPGPLYLIEVGTSAGLCLFPDRYGYRYRGPRGDQVLGDPSVSVLTCDVTGAGLPPGIPTIAGRVGLDRHLLNAGDPGTVAWLSALVWPGEDEREQRLRRCREAVADWAPRLETGDAVEKLPSLLAAVPGGLTPVVLHSATLAYLDRDRRQRFVDLVTSSGVHWVSLEGASVIESVAARLPELRPARPHFVLSLNGEPLGFASSHGAWLEWL